MVRPVWKGDISFGLVTIPVSMISVEEKKALHFHLLDARDKSRIRYQRINEETGKEVSWDHVVKAYEVEKDNYVVLSDDDFQKANADTFKSIDIDEFVHLNEIDTLYFEKPYYLLPEGKNKKAYVLLREGLKKTNTVGIGRVMIRTKVYLCLIIPHHDALVLNLIRFKQALRAEEELPFPHEPLKTYKISDREMKMATSLIHEMTATWEPDKYHDDYHDQLMEWIEQKASAHVTTAEKSNASKPKETVIDFISLLKKSMDEKAKAKRKTKKVEKK